MNDLEIRLTDALHHLAEQARPDDRLGEVLHGQDARSIGRPWWPISAAAAVVLLVASGLWIVGRGGSTERIHPGDQSTTVETTTNVFADLPGPDAVGVWTSFPNPGLGKRLLSTSVATDDGWFVWGGHRPFQASGAYFDGAAGTWRALPDSPLHPGADGSVSAVWTGTEVLVAAGGTSAQMAAFNPATFTWRTLMVPSELSSLWRHPAGHSYEPPGLYWMSGRVLAVTGSGLDKPAFASIVTFELDDPVDTLHSIAVPSTRVGGWPSASGHQIAFVDSTIGDCGGTRQVSIYDVAADTWSSVDLPHANWVPAIMEWTTSGLLVAGGMDCTSEQAGVRFGSLLQSDGTWREVADLPRDDRNIYAPTTGADGLVVSLDYDGTPFVYDPIGDRWWVGPPMATGTVDRPATVAGAILVGLGRDLVIWSPQISGGWLGTTGTVFHLTIPDPSTWPAP